MNGKCTVKEVRSKGKLIYWVLDNDTIILNTLGLSGMWHKAKSKHCDVNFRFEHPAGRLAKDHPKKLWFKDQLHYGTLKAVTHSGLVKKLASIGADVLIQQGEVGALGHSEWKEMCAKKGEWTFPQLLMNQRWLSGIGNYLKSEILYDARISPLKLIKEASPDQIERLYQSIITIPRHALETKLKLGLAIRGRFRIKIYRKKSVGGAVVEKVKTADKRTTHWIPSVQT